ncbi:MAG: hypothetical protein PWQ79_2002 [Thermococcaceae archaeon]|nr:hypothetical protein [Thermococcaceae archaeon]
MRFEECVEKGYLRRMEPQPELAHLSIKKARSFLESSRKNLEMGIYDGALVMAYLALFHAARALLFKDGMGGGRRATLAFQLISGNST